MKFTRKIDFSSATDLLKDRKGITWTRFSAFLAIKFHDYPFDAISWNLSKTNFSTSISTSNLCFPLWTFCYYASQRCDLSIDGNLRLLIHYLPQFLINEKFRLNLCRFFEHCKVFTLLNLQCRNFRPFGANEVLDQLHKNHIYYRKSTTILLKNFKLLVTLWKFNRVISQTLQNILQNRKIHK